MRTLFYEFPADAARWDVSDQYLFGADLLVAPVLEPGARQRLVYLPAGATWTELATGRLFEGGQSVVLDAPLHVIPVLARDGAVPELIRAAPLTGPAATGVSPWREAHTPTGGGVSG